MDEKRPKTGVILTTYPPSPQNFSRNGAVFLSQNTFIQTFRPASGRFRQKVLVNYIADYLLDFS